MKTIDLKPKLIDTFEDSSHIYNVYAKNRFHSLPYVVQSIQKRTGFTARIGKSFATLNEIYNQF